MSRSLALVASALLASFAAASPLGAQRLADHPRVQQALILATAWLEAQSAYEQIPGISAALVHDQELLWSGGFGYADLERSTPADAGTLYSICSISKLFTSIAVMRLRDEGRLRLDDPVAQHLPWFAIQRTVASSPEITIEGLLTHASGLPREADFPYWTGEFRFPTREQVMERLPSQETLYAAEQYFQYSNLGFTLAGEIVAATAGEPYGDYVRRTILQPLGLASTTTEMPVELLGGRLATGYASLGRDGARHALPPYRANGIVPAAGYASSVEDLARFASWQFRLLAGGDDEVLSANTLRRMQRVHWVDPDGRTTWGLGFVVRHEDGRALVGHGGSCPGYQTNLLLDPRDQLAVVFMANALGVNTGMYTGQLRAILAPALAAARADSGKVTAAVDTALAMYAGSYDGQPWSGEAVVVPWEDGLALLYLPSREPLRQLVKLKRAASEHTFHRVRDDGSAGETFRFEIGADGRSAAYWVHSNRYPRIAVARPPQLRAGAR